jgi:hypothetical protein
MNKTKIPLNPPKNPKRLKKKTKKTQFPRVGVMVLNATVNNISVIL